MLVNGRSVWVFDPGANFTTLLLPRSTTNTVPPESTATPSGTGTPLIGSTAGAFDPAASFTTPLLKSVTYTAPVASTATPWGWYRPPKASLTALVSPTANFT